MTDPILGQLRDAWLARPPAPARAEDIADMLITRFHAYEIPVGIIPASDYEIDEDVNAEDLWKLFTISDPQILNEILYEEEPEAAMEEVYATPIEESWPEILGNFRGEMEPVDEVGYRLITIQTGRRKRVSAVIEARDGIADGFKVYGGTDILTEVLIAHIGFAKYARTPENPYGVAIGDIDDEDFARYLRLAHAEGLLDLGTTE